MQMGGSQLRAQQTVDELELIQIDRVLTDDESSQLERALRRLGPKRDIWRWSAKDDLKLKLLIKRRGYSLRIKPFQRNDEVQRIAEDMGRSYLAVLKRVQRLRKKFDLPKQSMNYGESVRKSYVSQANPAPDMTGTVCIGEAARILGVTESWLNRRRKQGGGPKYVNFGRVVRYPEAELKRFPIQQIRDEDRSRQVGWLAATARMDPDCELSKRKRTG